MLVFFQDGISRIIPTKNKTMNHNPRRLPAASTPRRKRSAPFRSIALSLFNERDGAFRWTGAGLGYVLGSVRRSPWLGLFDDSSIQDIFPNNTTNRTTTTAASRGDSTIYQNVSQYDVFGRLIGINQTGANITTKSVTYTYNANGQRVGSTNKQSGETVSNSAWAYDAANRVTSIQHKTATDNLFADYGFTWDAVNRIAALETVDGTADYTYD